MLERIALHQTRLKTPGLGLDGKGVALGAKGLVLLPSLDRLVAWLSVFTKERSLEDLMASLSIEVLRSKLGTREIAMSFAAESSDRMDHIADTARLVGGFTFTGTSRHFVQYRDAAAPFGYDAAQLLGTDSAFALYHDRFSQTYDSERPIGLRSLLLRLMPRVDPSTRHDDGPLLLAAEQGLGPALVHYFVRSRVEGEVAVAEWPPESAFDDAPVRRYLLRLPEVPRRMRALLENTPGITAFRPVAPGICVELGYRHPVALRACPVFDPNALVLLRGRGDEPWLLERVPVMGDLGAFARIEFCETARVDELASVDSSMPEPVRVPLRIVPSTAPWRRVTATWISQAELPLFQRLAYALPHQTIARTEIALTERGAIVRSSHGIEAVPLGTFYVEVHPKLFVPAGYEVSPAISPDVLARSLQIPSAHAVFLDLKGAPLAIDEGAFVPLDTALAEAPPLEAVEAHAIVRALEDAPLQLELTSLGMLPMWGVEAPKASE
jgi:hypothetical protein